MPEQPQLDDAQLELRFGGRRHGHWQRITVRDSLDDLCSSVDLAITRAGTGSSIGIDGNTTAELLIGDELVTTVRIDNLRRTVGKASHQINLQARSLARELVDCTDSQTLDGLRLDEILKRLCSRYKVPLQVDAKTAVVPEFAMQCEAPGNALINAVRAADLLLYPQANGGLLLTDLTAGAPVATLQYGVNILSYEFIDIYTARYSHYIIKAYDLDNNNSLGSSAVDGTIHHYRPMHIMADKHGDSLGACDRRARMELRRRAARAHSLIIKLQGWRYPASDNTWRVWQLGGQVRVSIAREGINEVFVIGSRSFGLDDTQGKTTSLTLMHRDAWFGNNSEQPQPEIPPSPTPEPIQPAVPDWPVFVEAT